MRALLQSLSRISITNTTRAPSRASLIAASPKPYSTKNDGGNKEPDWAAGFGATTGPSGPMGWETGASSWSTGLTKDHFDGKVVGHQITERPADGPKENPTPSPPRAPYSSYQERKAKRERMSLLKRQRFEKTVEENIMVLAQATEPGSRGSYLTDGEKNEMYKKHKENPEVYTVEELAKEYRIIRQRVHAILWLKEIEEEEGAQDASCVASIIELFPDHFKYHDREFHVATLPYKPNFTVMPEGWDGTPRDPDEVHYEVSMKEDQMMYKDFVLRMNFNKMKLKNMVKCHPQSRTRPLGGWNFMVEKLGPEDKRGNRGGWKFMSQGDGSIRPLNEFEKIFVKRETPRLRKPKLLG